VFLLAMRERARGRAVRAGAILTVSDVVQDPDAPDARRIGEDSWFRLPEDELLAAIDRTIGAAMEAAVTLAG
jgi:hypothetical protein